MMRDASIQGTYRGHGCFAWSVFCMTEVQPNVIVILSPGANCAVLWKARVQKRKARLVDSHMAE